MGYSWLVLKMEVIDLDFQGHFGHFWLRILGNIACPCDDSSQIWTRITKFVPCMHSGILSADTENGGHWPWLSRSFWSFWLRILGNLASPFDKLLWIWARIIKFAPNMNPGIFAAIIENGSHWPWHSRSFGNFVSRNGMLHVLHVPNVLLFCLVTPSSLWLWLFWAKK